MAAEDLSHITERTDLAAVFRWAARLGWQSGICNHFSLAVTEDRVLINPQGLHWSEITPVSLLLVDHEGRVLEGEGTVERTALFVHMPTHAGAADAKCILHAHLPYATALTCMEDGRLVNCHQDALRFHGIVAYDDSFNGAVTDEAEGRRIAAALGNCTVLFMAHHGVTVVGPTVARAFDDLYYLESACRFQVLAMSSGRPLRIMDDETVRRNVRFFAEEEEQVVPHLDAIKRMLDRDEPEWRG